MESPQSITTQFYYKGFSILLTKRSLNTNTELLLQDTMATIDWAIAHSLKPSWNEETNKQALGSTPAKTTTVAHPSTPGDYQREPVSQTVEQFENQDICNKCGASMVINPKTMKKFCSNKCWLKK
jgi:hypothetical protein